MKSGVRIGIAAAAWAGLVFGSAAAAAQDAASSEQPAAVGPRELQNFSLEGTVMRQAEPPAAREPAPAPAPAQATARPLAETVQAAPRSSPEAAPNASPSRGAPVANADPAPSRGPSTRPSSTPRSSVEPQFGSETTPVASSFPADPLPAAPPLDLGAENSPSQLPWHLAVLLLALGAGAYAFRQRSRGHQLALAGAPGLAFEAPLERQPAPRAAPPKAPQPAAPLGVVSTRLRPWLEISFKPTRCVVEGEGISIHFELELFNSGSAPARQVLVEAAMFNAGPEQDTHIGRFFAHPVAKGERLPLVDALKRVTLASAVHLTGTQLRVFEAQGRRFVVPLVGFNALYSWSGGEAQTSASYLVGRDTQGEKLAPFLLDGGLKTFSKLGARESDLRVRK